MECDSPKTVAFIDYEHWYYSLQTLHKRPPNIQSWFDDAKTKGNLVDVTFFGDFSDSGLARQINDIRRFTSKIIETKNTDTHLKKDYTDFIILDNIYQHVLNSPDTEQIILFTGDGHFASVVSYLRNFRAKKVGIYGVANATSQQLKKSASWWVELPLNNELLNEAYQAIFENFRFIEGRGILQPVFMQTVRAVSEYTGLDDDILIAALRNLLDMGVVQQIEERHAKNYHSIIKVLKIDWKMAQEMQGA